MVNRRNYSVQWCQHHNPTNSAFEKRCRTFMFQYIPVQIMAIKQTFLATLLTLTWKHHKRPYTLYPLRPLWRRFVCVFSSRQRASPSRRWTRPPLVRNKSSRRMLPHLYNLMSDVNGNSLANPHRGLPEPSAFLGPYESKMAKNGK